jgi:hypothetical protein
VNKYKYTGDGGSVSTKGGLVVATGYNRIVHGKRGAYVEFTDEQINQHVLCIKKEDSWRMSPYWQKHVYYILLYTDDDVLVYYQLKEVDYADYVVGVWYISPIYLQEFEVDNADR